MKCFFIILSLFTLIACDGQPLDGTPGQLTLRYDPDTTPVPPPAILGDTNVALLDVHIEHVGTDGEYPPIACEKDDKTNCFAAALPDKDFISHYFYPDSGTPFPVTANSTVDDIGNAKIVSHRTDQSILVYHLQVGGSADYASLKLEVDNVKSYGVVSNVSNDVNIQITPTLDYPSPLVAFESLDSACHMGDTRTCEIEVTTQHFSGDFYRRYSGYIVGKVVGDDTYVLFERPVDLSESYYSKTNIFVDLSPIGTIAPDQEIELRLVVTDAVLNPSNTHEKLLEIPRVTYISAPLKLFVSTNE